ncbi:hypothetical protein KC361_g229 [Hortaea werneckii]|nr:hypothetical protein KC361_g229 [Hortaea werneckii]
MYLRSSSGPAAQAAAQAGDWIDLLSLGHSRVADLPNIPSMVQYSRMRELFERKPTIMTLALLVKHVTATIRKLDFARNCLMYLQRFEAGESGSFENLVCTKTFCIPSSFLSNFSYTLARSSTLTRCVIIFRGSISPFWIFFRRSSQYRLVGVSDVDTRDANAALNSM